MPRSVSAGLGLAAPGDEDDAVLALAGRAADRLAFRNAIEVEADILPAGALRRDVDEAVLAVGAWRLSRNMRL